MRTKIEIDDGLMREGEKDRLKVGRLERWEKMRRGTSQEKKDTFDLSCVVSAPGKGS